MIYYPHYIGDFDRATRHLSRLERSIYRDLLDVYYKTESRLTLDRKALCRKIVARSKPEISAVAQVLEEFFLETETGWFHDRCEEEIASYHGNTSAKSAAGKASAEAKRKRALEALSSGAEREADAAPTESKQTINRDSTDGQQTDNKDSTDGQRNSTNQNQNQNQNTTHTPAVDQPPVGAAVPAVCVLVCQKMQEVGVKDANAADAELARLIGVGADAAVFVDAAALAVGKQRGFSYALGVVRNRLADAAAGPVVAAGGAPVRVSAVWHESAAGVDRMAAELGLAPLGEFEQRPAFKARVMAAAAVRQAGAVA